jgi:hypothetical protein
MRNTFIKKNRQEKDESFNNTAVDITNKYDNDMEVRNRNMAK